MTAKPTILIRTPQSPLGQGAFSCVFHATDRDSGRVVALKQSRVSARIIRTHLHYEARVLQLLQGHPTIPAVYGYGRLAHFELLTMELLGHDLDERMEQTGSLALPDVVDIADQLFDALAHVHRHGLIHRDIKPGNVVFKLSTTPEQVCLIDFGLACHPRVTPRPPPPPTRPESGCPHICGTPTYASINAHHQRDLAYRDDVESLAYTLVYILRGVLPWTYFSVRGTDRARLRQVLAQKERCDGARLAHGLPEVFGALVDYARGMAADVLPEYDVWRQRFRQCLSGNDVDLDYGAPKAAPRHSRDSPPPPPPPVNAGDVVLLQLLPIPTVESYRLHGSSHENSYIPDPELLSDAWRTPARPALVLDVAWDARKGLYKLTVLGIRIRGPDDAPDDGASVPIAGPGAAADPEHVVFLGPDWPLADACCYVYPHAQAFHCLPTQEPVPAVWSADAAGLALLRRRLATRAPPGGLRAADADARHAARLRTNFATFCAQLSPLRRAHAAAGAGEVDWAARRAWLDECVRAARRHDLDDGYWWTGAEFADCREVSADSYCGRETWPRRQRPRDESLTLSSGLQHKDEGICEVVPGLDWVTLEEEEQLLNACAGADCVL